MEATAIEHDETSHIPPDVFRRRWVILGVLCMSLVIIVIGNTSLNVAMPRMSEALGLTNSQQQWVVDSYALIFAGMLFTAGTLDLTLGAPTISSRNIEPMKAAIERYSRIVAQGGWEPVPMMQMASGTTHPAVEALRRRLEIEGDLLSG